MTSSSRWLVPPGPILLVSCGPSWGTPGWPAVAPRLADACFADACFVLPCRCLPLPQDRSHSIFNVRETLRVTRGFTVGVPPRGPPEGYPGVPPVGVPPRKHDGPGNRLSGFRIWPWIGLEVVLTCTAVYRLASEDGAALIERRPRLSDGGNWNRPLPRQVTAAE